MLASAQSTVSLTNLSFSSLDRCSHSSYVLSKYGPDDFLEPCVLYDIQSKPHRDESKNEDIDNNRTSEIALIQVTPSNCHNHRDGAATAITLLNSDNDGLGTTIGYHSDHFIKFRLISIVGGNVKNIGNDVYKVVHSFLLDSVLDEIENAHFILGSCSFAADADKPIALKREKIVISQVGPPGFYKDVNMNPFVFGIHVNSDTYPMPALQALYFHLKTTGTPTSLQPVRVIYRDKSEFFYSTCRSVIDEAQKNGFDMTIIEYDPNEENGSGVPNSQNITFLENLADLLCDSSNDNEKSLDDGDKQLAPAIFACVNSEVDIILARIRSNGCRPHMSWFTTATWQWASDNPDTVPYFQGGGQWHPNFKYSDNFFQTGQDVLKYGLDEFGYNGTYDHVVSYAIPNLIAEVMQTFFRVDDFPNVAKTLANRYEDLRKSLLFINAQTIFGPVSFNKYQRNIGRGAASVQWVPASYANDLFIDDVNITKNCFVLGCMSPFDQADAAIIIPSPSGSKCPPGTFVNQTLIETEPALLGNKCSACPVDTYTLVENEELQCFVCPSGSSTMGNIASVNCVQEHPNLIPKGVKYMGCVFVAISWFMAIAYLSWMIVHKNGSAIKNGQPEFLFILCVGAIISSSAIIPLTLAEADSVEDTIKASRYCQAVPYLYFLGWILMYSSLTAKSYRLTKIASAARRMQRIKVTARETYNVIIAFLVLEGSILITWQFVDPFVYVRRRIGRSVDEYTGVVTIETVGNCSSDSTFLFVGPIVFVHFCLMIVTNKLLWKVRNMSDRYQEQMFVALASIYIFELGLIGAPILFALKDANAARYIIMAGIIFLNDTGVLSLIFVPKIKFQNQDYSRGMTATQRMNRDPRIHTQTLGAQNNELPS